VIGSEGEGALRRLKLTVPADLGAVDGADARIEEFLRGTGADDDLIYAAVLALEEVLTNTCKYGFPEGERGRHEIVVEADLPPGSLRLRIDDDGREFDPLNAPPPPLEDPVEERPIGGLGIHLLKNLADHLEYRRVEGHNVLTLLFSLDPKNRRFTCR
jgi:serine/threonine-protein kinase RsbW